MKKILIVVLLLLLTAGVARGAETVRSGIKYPEVEEAMELLKKPSPDNFEKSRALLNTVLKKNPKDAGAHMGMVYLGITEYTASPKGGSGPLQSALRHVDAALAIDPRLEDGYRKKSLVLFLSGRKDEGLSLLQSALKRWPASQDLHEAYLAYLLNLGRIKEAERFSDLKGSRVSDKKRALVRLGRVWLQAGYPEQAEECYEHSLYLGETVQVWAALGRSFILKKEYSKAIDFFRNALKIDAKYLEIYDDLAFCFHQTGKPREAVRWMEPYTAAFPNDMAALGNLAGLYEGIGEKVKARLAWMKVKAGSNDPAQIRLAEERLRKLRKK